MGWRHAGYSAGPAINLQRRKVLFRLQLFPRILAEHDEGISESLLEEREEYASRYGVAADRVRRTCLGPMPCEGAPGRHRDLPWNAREPVPLGAQLSAGIRPVCRPVSCGRRRLDDRQGLHQLL